MGRYKEVLQDPDSEIQVPLQTFLDQQLSTVSQWSIAEHMLNDKEKDHSLNEDQLEAYMEKAKETEPDWDNKTAHSCCFVEYDEELYRALVKSGTGNGEVSTMHADLEPIWFINYPKIGLAG